MTDLSVSIALPIPRARQRTIGTIIASIAGATAESIRKRWVYHRTLSEIEGYSARSLQDIGAHRGIHEFARRAARL
jgi:hypothetical protein